MAKNFERGAGARVTGGTPARFGAAFAVGVAGIAILLGAAACGPTIQAGSLEPGAGGDTSSPSTRTTDPTDGPTDPSEPPADSRPPEQPDGDPPTDEEEDDELALNVCELVPAKRVRAILGRDKTPTMDQPEQVAPGVPGLGTVYRCTYRFAPGETAQFVTISAMTETGEPDPTTYVANVLGEGYKPVGGYGDAAGSIRAARFGNGTGAFAQARGTDAGVAGVFVQGPEESTDDQFGRLADEFFTALKTFEEEATEG